jgi:hypothetical protein
MEESNHSFLKFNYFEGILHTYEMLNQPDTNLVYEYEIIAFDKTEDIATSLKESFIDFSTKNIKLKSITVYELETHVKSWFFTSGEVSKLSLNEDKQVRIASNFCDIMVVTLGLSEYYFIDNLDSYYDLGVAYDYLVLIGTTKNYLLYFRYSD